MNRFRPHERIDTVMNKRKKLIVRIIAVVLAALMLLGSVTMIVQIFIFQAGAMSSAEYDNLTIRVGMMYGNGVKASFGVKSENGFTIGAVGSEDNAFRSIWKTDASALEACTDNNLSLIEGIYKPAQSNFIIGGYHLEIEKNYQNEKDAAAAVDSANSSLRTAGIYSSVLYAFPFYCDSGYRVRIGDFASAASANSSKSKVASALKTDSSLSAVSPSSSAVTLINSGNNLIVLEFDRQDAAVGVEAIQQSAETVCPIVSPNNNQYEGVFEFSRYGDGIAVTNIVAVESYVAGVVPWEIGSAWHHEAQKAFAIAVRSFALSTLGKHQKAYGFDLCNGTCCQVYAGIGRLNDNVATAVSETRGMVASYNGKVANTMYCAVTGGCTVNASEVWNGTDYPYLRAVATPWEDYASHENGQWVSEVSPRELAAYLRDTKGFTELTGDIADISIDRYATNSTYVYQVTVTDVNGNQITRNGTYNVNSLFAKFVKSANFVVGKSGEIEGLLKKYPLLTADGKQYLSAQDDISILTPDGVKAFSARDSLSVYTAEGKITLSPDAYDVPEEANELLNDPDNNNFIFIGKGWGHGIGMSQWGAKCLAEAGGSYEQIITSYFTGVSLNKYYELAN